MKFKVSEIAYDGLIIMHLLILVLWIVLIIMCPIQNLEDFYISILLLLFMELLMFACSPFVHRIVIIDDQYVTEKWLFFECNKIDISKISDIGVCTYLSGNQVRQFAYISAVPMSDNEIKEYDNMSVFRRKIHHGRFITIEHPQKKLDDCMTSIAEKNNLVYRHFSVQ